MPRKNSTTGGAAVGRMLRAITCPVSVRTEARIVA
jgi:hypothetical protein